MNVDENKKRKKHKVTHFSRENHYRMFSTEMHNVTSSMFGRNKAECRVNELIVKFFFFFSFLLTRLTFFFSPFIYVANNLLVSNCTALQLISIISFNPNTMLKKIRNPHTIET